jgi:hypothetical protein
MTDEERELFIAACGKRFLAAHAKGDMTAAREWLDEQNKAVKERSAAQVAKLEADYFGAEGERAQREHQQRLIG